MTDGQIEKLVANFRAMLVKHRTELGSEAVQCVLGQPEFTSEQFGLFRKRVEAVSDMIVRRVKVDRKRTPKEVLDATGRSQYTNSEVVDAMPRGEGEEVEICFFKLNRYVSDDDLEKEYNLRGLRPADPYSLAFLNEADPAFADGHLNATHWKDSSNRWCYTAFSRGGGGRNVDVDRNDSDWGDGWWFAGLRNSLVLWT